MILLSCGALNANTTNATIAYPVTVKAVRANYSQATRINALENSIVPVTTKSGRRDRRIIVVALVVALVPDFVV